MDADQVTPVHAIRSLTIAVWSLVFVAIINAALIACLWIVPMVFASSRGAMYSHESVSIDGRPPFHKLSAEQKIAKAATILVTEYQPDGDRMKAVVTDIPKQAGGSRYKVGSEFTDGGYYPDGHTSFGKGQVVFFMDGDESMMSYAAVYDSHDRLMGLDFMPLAKLRELAGKSSGKE